jgi:hypothetical protein
VSQADLRVPFQIPPHSGLLSLAQARVDLPPPEFRQRLRRHLLDHPGLTLAQVGRILGVSRQRAAQMAGPFPLARTRPAPKRDQAAEKLADLTRRVAAGESAEKVAAELKVSLGMAMRLGWRAKQVRPSHGKGRGRQCCNCWRCRRASGAASKRGPRTSAEQTASVVDWLAWRDPDEGTELSQTEIGRLAGVGQPVVSRIARSAGGLG